MILLHLKRRIQKWWSRAPWLTLLALLSVLYAVGYLMMLWQEPHGSPIRSLATYTYFFVVTVTTVGFGGGLWWRLRRINSDAQLFAMDEASFAAKPRPIC